MAPGLRTIGIGHAKQEDGTWISVIDLVRGGPRPLPPRDPEPIIYPVHAQREVPLAFPGNEIPDPIPRATEKMAGFPITLTFPRRLSIVDARAWLEDEAGKEIQVWFSSPTRPANEKHARSQQNTICLFPREVLRPGTRYVVHVEARIADNDWSRTWTFTTQPARELTRRIPERALARMNALRQLAGLEPAAFDQELSSACLAHARYLVRHLDRDVDVRLDDERPDLAGFSEEGKAIARRALIRRGGGTGPADAIDWTLASVLNRHLILNPSVKKVGLGTAMQGGVRGWVWVIHVPTTRAKEDRTTLLYPARGQKDVPLHFGREIASMIPGESKEHLAGYGITANFSPLARVKGVSAQLVGADETEVSCWLSTPEMPIKGTGSYKQILLIPKKPLAPATTYTARMQAMVDGVTWSETWSFSTLDFAREQARIAEALVKRMNQIRALAGLGPVTLDEKLSDGCGKHADYIVRNLDHPKLQGLGIHDEDPSLPGATPEGARSGNAAVIALVSDPLDSVDNWLATLYHRLPLLNPRITRIGYGQAMHPTRGWATVLDATSGRSE